MTKWLLQREFAIEFLPKFYSENSRAFFGDDFLESSHGLPQQESSTRVIPIQGVLEASPGYWKIGNNYQEIVNKITEANNSPNVSKIILAINSPGGAVDGIIPAMNAIKNSKKPIDAVVLDRAASAAYMLATQANNIYTLHSLSSVGSVGVVCEWADFTGLYEKMGIKIHTVTNSQSPDKRIDINTEEGSKHLQQQLDDIYLVFEDLIAKGRKTSSEEIRKKYGNGKMFLSQEAIENKMVDGQFIVKKSNQFMLTMEKKEMSELTKLFSSAKEMASAYPEFADQIRKEGREEGVKSENRRVRDWLEFNAVDSKKVSEGISSGEEISNATAAILAAKLNGSEKLSLRESDNPEKLNTATKQNEKQSDKSDADKAAIEKAKQLM